MKSTIPYRSNELRKILKINDKIQKPNYENQISLASEFLEKFQIMNKSFSFIIDFSTMQYIYMSESCYSITGHDNWAQLGVEFAMSLYHPDDEKIASKIHQLQTKHFNSLPQNERKNYVYTHDFRIKHANGNYIRINHHAIMLEFDEFLNPLSSFCICNDITDLKTDSFINFTISKVLNNRIKTVYKEKFLSNKELKLSSREFEVLQLIAEGFINNLSST